MKVKIVVALLLIVVLTGYFIFSRNVKNGYEEGIREESTITELTITPFAPLEESNTTIETTDPKNGNYKVNWLVIRGNSNLYLYSNETDRLTSEELRQEQNCNHIVSAGFIDQNNDHIGLFVNHDGVINKSSVSSTFNGYFSIDENNIASVSTQAPNNPKISVQSGPLLYLDNRPLTLTLKSDENSRRIVAAVNRQNEALFLVFYLKNNPFSGPLLSELPTLIDDLERNSSINITDAINLDGGTHSVFKSGQLNLTEASIAGGYFCVKY